MSNTAPSRAGLSSVPMVPTTRNLTAPPTPYWCERYRGGCVEDDDGFFLAALSREMSLTLSSSVSFFHSCTLRALGPKTSLPSMDITKRQSLSLWGRLTEGDSKTVCLRCICKCVNSSVAVTPESLDISWASRTVELALCRRSSRREASFSTESFATDERKKIITFCRKLYTTSKDVEEMVAEWAERVAKASSQYGHFAILVSGTCSTAVEVGSFIISGESSCSSQRIGYVNVKAGRKVLRRVLFVPGIFDCRRRPLVRLATGFWLLSMLVETQGSVDDVLGLLNGRPLLMQFILLLFKFWFSLQVTAEGTIVLGSGCGKLIKCLSPEVWESMRLISSCYADVLASRSWSLESLWEDWLFLNRPSWVSRSLFSRVVVAFTGSLT